jgi:pimeloyl-ACP methyl ester carboxylesterase
MIGRMPWIDGEVEAGGVVLATRDYGGAGTPLLLLHGGGSTLETWNRLAPLLAASVRVVAYDARGHGRSGTPATAAAGDLLEDVGRVAARFGLTAPVLVGRSMGGATALRFARAGGGCRAVVCVDGAIVRTDEPVEVVEEEPYRARLRAFGVPADRLDYFVQLRRLGEELAAGETVAIYDEIACPVLLVLAERGGTGAGAYAHRQRAAIAGLPVETHWLDSGHAIQEERPDELTRLIRSFTTRLEAGPGT